MKTRIGICAVLATMMWLAPSLVLAAPSGEARPAEWATVVDPTMNSYNFV